MKKYIEAEELLKRLNARKYSVEKTTRRQVAYNAAISDACRSVDMMPAADAVEVRHGHWVKDKNLYKCTACNDLLTVAGWADCIPEKQIYTAFKYCPNCGASMDEVE